MRRFGILMTFAATMFLSAAPIIKDYSEFTRYWNADPEEREAIFQKYPDWGIHWMTHDPTRITRLSQEEPQLFYQLVNIRPYMLNQWQKRDKANAQKWLMSEETHAFIKKNPRMLTKVEDPLANELLLHWPDLFIPYFRTDVILATVWTARNPQVLQKLYDDDPEVKAFIDGIPQLKAQLPSE